MKTNPEVLIAILGLSDSPERYGHRAYKFLQEHGYTNLVGIANKDLNIDDIPVYKELSEIEGEVDTLTVYVNPKIVSTLSEQILSLKPKRVIFNPGTADHLVEELLKKNGIEVVNGCTLVMLSTEVF